jgi:hypothetical protein
MYGRKSGQMDDENPLSVKFTIKAGKQSCRVNDFRLWWALQLQFQAVLRQSTKPVRLRLVKQPELTVSFNYHVDFLFRLPPCYLFRLAVAVAAVASL